MTSVNLLHDYAKIIYPSIPENTQHQYTNVLLIDRLVPEYTTFVESVNATTFPIMFSSLSSGVELVDILRRYFTNITRIGFCFTSTLDVPLMFVDNTPLFHNDEPLFSPHSQNVELIVSIIREFSIQNVDYLACDTLKYSNWRNYYDILRESTGVIVGASDDKTGNIKYGGDWILESTSQDIETIYFTQSIQYYQYLLDTAFSNFVGNFQTIGLVTDGTYLYGGLYSPTAPIRGGVVRVNISTPTDISYNWGSPDQTVVNGTWGLIVTGGNLYLANLGSPGNIYKINTANPSSGQVKQWVSPSTHPGLSTILCMATDGTYLYASQSATSSVARFHLQNPTTNYSLSWATSTQGAATNQCGMAIYNGYLYLYDSTLGRISKISLSNPSVDYTANFYVTAFNNRGLTNLTAADGYLYISDQVNKIYKLNLTTLIATTITTTNSPFGMAKLQNTLYYTYLNGSGGVYSVDDPLPPVLYICFKKDSRILTNTGYRKIQHLKRGDLVKTFRHGFVPVYMVGKKDIYHSPTRERSKNHLYKCTPEHYGELTDDLVLTGCHSILVDDYVDKRQLDKTIEVNGNVYVTEGKYRLPVCADERASIYEKEGKYTVYHIALENDDYYMNYGIYANGLLVESTSKRFLEKMNIME
jgi:hypothetical protein